jgi:hypothetical protein
MSYSPPPVIGPPASGHLRWIERVLLVTTGSVLIGLLVLAARLTPNPLGMGTHQQLGLPPCTLVTWFGVRCPSCGMTTSWAYLTRGRAEAAVRANAGGTLLAMTAAVCGPWLVLSGLLGRWVVGPPHEWVTLGLGLTILAVTVVDWTIKLSLGW